MIKSNPNIKGLNIFNHNYLYTAYADDTTFFLNDQKSIRELMKTFKLFSKFSGLKPNILKCEVAGIGFRKRVKMAVYCINPIQDGLFWGCSRMEVAKMAPLPKLCHRYPTMMKLGTVIPYLKEIQKIYESRDTPLEFCRYQQFFTGNQQILLYQEIHA